MRIKQFLFFLVFSLSSVAFGQDINEVSGKLMGQLIYLEDKNLSKHNIHYNYHIKIKKDGESFVYPVKIKDKKEEKTLKPLINKTVLFHGSFLHENISLNEKSSTVLVLVPENIQELNLKSLTLNTQGHVLEEKDEESDKKDQFVMNEFKPYHLYKSDKESKKITIPDNVANTLIFASTAALLAKMLLGGSNH